MQVQLNLARTVNELRCAGFRLSLTDDGQSVLVTKGKPDAVLTTAVRDQIKANKDGIVCVLKSERETHDECASNIAEMIRRVGIQKGNPFTIQAAQRLESLLLLCYQAKDDVYEFRYRLANCQADICDSIIQICNDAKALAGKELAAVTGAIFATTPGPAQDPDDAMDPTDPFSAAYRGPSLPAEVKAKPVINLAALLGQPAPAGEIVNQPEIATVSELTLVSEPAATAESTTVSEPTAVSEPIGLPATSSPVINMAALLGQTVGGAA